MAITIKDLYIYPVKSLPGIAADSLTLTADGVLNDRKFLLVNTETSTMLTQRGHPQLALLILSYRDDDTLLITAPSGASIAIPMNDQQPSEESGEQFSVQVWSDTVKVASFAGEMGHRFNEFFSDYLQEPVALTTNAPGFARVRHKPVGSFTVGMADGYPLLICSEASLHDLNHKLGARQLEPVSMMRFRPNIVVAGVDAFAEDDWQDFVIGDQLKLSKADLCDRCVLINVDPITAGTSKEPLATLIKHRLIDNKARFGIRAIFHGEGSIEKGQPIKTAPQA